MLHDQRGEQEHVHARLGGRQHHDPVPRCRLELGRQRHGAVRPDRGDLQVPRARLPGRREPGSGGEHQPAGPTAHRHAPERPVGRHEEHADADRQVPRHLDVRRSGAGCARLLDCHAVQPVSIPPEQPTGADGWATLTFQRGSRLPGQQQAAADRHVRPGPEVRRERAGRHLDAAADVDPRQPQGLAAPVKGLCGRPGRAAPPTMQAWPTRSSSSLPGTRRRTSLRCSTSSPPACPTPTSSSSTTARPTGPPIAGRAARRAGALVRREPRAPRGDRSRLRLRARARLRLRRPRRRRRPAPGRGARRLLEIVRAGEADVAVGSRFVSGDGLPGSTATSPARARQFGTGAAAAGDEGGARAPLPRRDERDVRGRRAAMPILAEPYESGAPEVESLLRLQRGGLTVVEVPVDMRERASGESKLQGKRAVQLVRTVAGTLLLVRRVARPGLVAVSRPRLIAVCGYSDGTGEESARDLRSAPAPGGAGGARGRRRAPHRLGAGPQRRLGGRADGRGRGPRPAAGSSSTPPHGRRSRTCAAAASVAREVEASEVVLVTSGWHAGARRRCFAPRCEARARPSRLATTDERPSLRARLRELVCWPLVPFVAVAARAQLLAGRSGCSGCSGWRGGPCSTPTAVHRRMGPTRRPSRRCPAGRPRRDHALIQGRSRPVPSPAGRGCWFPPACVGRTAFCLPCCFVDFTGALPWLRRSLTPPLPVETCELLLPDTGVPRVARVLPRRVRPAARATGRPAMVVGMGRGRCSRRGGDDLTGRSEVTGATIAVADARASDLATTGRLTGARVLAPANVSGAAATRGTERGRDCVPTSWSTATTAPALNPSATAPQPTFATIGSAATLIAGPRASSWALAFQISGNGRTAYPRRNAERTLLRARKSNDPIADSDTPIAAATSPYGRPQNSWSTRASRCWAGSCSIDRLRARSSSPAISAASASGASERPFRPCSASGSRIRVRIRSRHSLRAIAASQTSARRGSLPASSDR